MKSTVLLLIGGLITKIIGMFIRIIMSRRLGTEGMGIYTLIMPTFSLLIALAQFGFPISISKLVSEKKRSSLKLIFSIIPIACIINFVLIVFMFLFSQSIATNLLHESRCYLGLICIGLTLPFISCSSILRGYFFGKERMVPHVLSNVIEDLVRMALIYFGIPYFLQFGIDKCIAFMILTNVISESISIIVLLLFLPKKINTIDLKFDNKDIKDVVLIGLPATGSRIVGNIGYFLEPIILTSLLLFSGYSNSFIVNEYGIVNGYVLPIVLLPSFFTSAISHALLPSVSFNFVNGRINLVIKKIKQALFVSLLVGIPATLIFMIFPKQLMLFIYNTDLGVPYIRFLAIPFVLHYVQAPISACLQAMGKVNDLLVATILGIIVKLITLIIGSLLHIGLYGLLISVVMGVIFTTLFDCYHLKKYLKAS